MPKQLISLISTHGKTPKEVSAEVWEAYQKYKRVQKELAEKKEKEDCSKNPQ